jgi:nitrile hydratase
MFDAIHHFQQLSSCVGAKSCGVGAPTLFGATAITKTDAAKAWLDDAFRQRLLANGKAAVAELGIDLPPHHRHLVVLENTALVHNVICCTLCSCTAFTVIGLPPDWYKDLNYRARIVRESRSVLREMGLDLPDTMELRVWDTTADTRYMVMPQRPSGTDGLTVDQLTALISKDALIGVARI